jgi:hypothetical protein
MGRTLALFLVLLGGCGRTDLGAGPLDQTGDEPGDGEPNVPGPNQPDPNQPDPNEPEPTEPQPEPVDDELPEITVATGISNGPFGAESTEFSLFAPFHSRRGPFALKTSAPINASFSPNGTRFAFLDAQGLSVVDTWPPVSRRIETRGIPSEFAFLDDERLVVNLGNAIELHELESENMETLHEVPPDDADLPPFYVVRPSPDARFIAYGWYSGGLHEVWLIDLETSSRAPVMSLEAGAVIAWFDWAPDSEHLGISVTDSEGVWLRSYSVSTAELPSEAQPISFELEPTASIPTFAWSPTGDALHYLYQKVDLDTGETDWRLYFVDMTNAAPGPSVRLSTFGERNWPSEGYWSPSGDMVAFKAEFAGANFRAAEFVSRLGALPEGPIKQHEGEFSSVLKQEWSPDNQALYFTARGEDEVERVYKSSLTGNSVLLSLPTADVRGLYVSPEPGCVAYSHFNSGPAVVVIDEALGNVQMLGVPESNDPNWSGNLDSSRATWVTNRSGEVAGLLYVTSSVGNGDALAWVEVSGCFTSEPESVIAGRAQQSISGLTVSTVAPSGERQ